VDGDAAVLAWPRMTVEDPMYRAAPPRGRALFTAALVTALVGGVAPAAANTVVVTADKLVDVATGKESDRPQVVIVDGRITQVGKQGDALPPARPASICRA